MDLLKCFNFNDEEHKINVQGTHEEPLFQANQIAKILGIKNISNNLTGFTKNEKEIHNMDTLGGIQKTLFLTELGLYRLINRSRKPIANTFQVWACQIIKELRINGVYHLNAKNEIEKKLMDYNYAINAHNLLLNTFDNKNVVYIFKLAEIDGKILIKIGSTGSIKEREKNISTTYGYNNILLLYAVHCERHISFEKSLRNDEFIKKYKYSVPTKDGKDSRETYLVTEEEFEEIIKIIIETEKNINKNINTLQMEEIRLETEKTKTENELLAIKKESLSIEKEALKVKQKELDLEIIKLNDSKKPETENLKQSADESTDEQEYETETDDDVDDIPKQNNNTKNCYVKERKISSRVPKVYQYDPTNLKTPIRKYESPIAVEREFPDIYSSNIPRSSKNNTIYKNYRWLALKRDEELPEEIPPTKNLNIASPEIRFIAMIDIKKTKILEVFSNQKDAVEARNMKTNGFSRAIKNDSISSGHYWKFFDDCTEEMKTAFLATSKLPEKFVKSNGKRVEQIDPKTDQVIETYHSNSEICKKFQMSAMSLKKASETGNIHHGYKWRIVA